MKDYKDLQTRFRSELEGWFKEQTMAPDEEFFLYYLESTLEHDGDILICRDTPPLGYQLAASHAIRRDFTVDRNMRFFDPILRKLPVLSIK